MMHSAIAIQCQVLRLHVAQRIKEEFDILTDAVIADDLDVI